MLSLLAVALVTGTQKTDLNVFAAASLRESFTAIGKAFEAGHPGTTVRFTFAGSQTLATQIVNGAPADAFASAAPENLRAVSTEKGSDRVFVRNRLQIAVRSGLTLKDVSSLTNVQRLVVADKAVPVGRYTEQFFGKAEKELGASWVAAVRSKIVSREEDVKAVLAKVRLGEADAGIVYASDVLSAGNAVTGLKIPDRLNVDAVYPVGIVAGSPNRAAAKDFVKFLFEGSSQAAFERFGLRSVTRPVSVLELVSGGKTKALSLPLGGSQASVMDLPGVKRAKQVMFIGGDGCSQTLSVADLRTRKAVLVRESDGNYQLVVPGSDKHFWVRWLRRIELR